MPLAGGSGTVGWLPQGMTVRLPPRICVTASSTVFEVAMRISTRAIAPWTSEPMKAAPVIGSGRWKVVAVTPVARRSTESPGVGVRGSWTCTTSNVAVGDRRLQLRGGVEGADAQP